MGVLLVIVVGIGVVTVASWLLERGWAGGVQGADDEFVGFEGVGRVG